MDYTEIYPIAVETRKHLWLNPQTWEYEWIHPILDFDSSYSDLKPEVKSWLDRSNIPYRFGREMGEYCLRFQSLSDLTLFKMCWE